MSITSTDLNTYASINRPKGDIGASGGAIDDERRPVFTPLTVNSVIAADGDYTAESRTINIEGRDATGAIITDTIVLSGTTEVLGTKVFERIQDIFISATDPASTVNIKQGAGGPLIGTIPVNELGFYRLFQRSASESSATDRYEKVFWRNDHPLLVLNDAEVTLITDPGAKIQIGLATAKDDSGSVVNRKTAPSGVTFVDDNVALPVPDNTLEPGSAIGVWIKFSLFANDSPQKNTFTTRLSGTSV